MIHWAKEPCALFRTQIDNKNVSFDFWGPPVTQIFYGLVDLCFEDTMTIFFLIAIIMEMEAFHHIVNCHDWGSLHEIDPVLSHTLESNSILGSTANKAHGYANANNIKR